MKLYLSVSKSESTRSYGGDYTRSNISGKEKVCLSEGEPIRKGLIGGEIRYSVLQNLRFSNDVIIVFS